MLASLGTELIIILILTVANGFFSGSEIAIVSARRSRLEAQAATGNRGARQALALADTPDRFLATVQVGISLIGTFAAAFGGARIGDVLAVWLGSFPTIAPYAETVALAIVVLLITYLSLVLGELVPKRLALQHAERIAVIAAPVMTGLATVARPLVAVLSFSVNLVLRLLGQHRAVDSPVTQEDIVYMVAEGATSGTVEANEARFIERVFQFTDRPVRKAMTPRTEITAVELDTPWPQIVNTFLASGYSRLPVYQGSLDHIVGILHVKDAMRVLATSSDDANIMQLLRPVTFVLESQHIDDVLTMFRRQGTHLGMVIDEYGQVDGLVTLEDLLEELVGEIRDEYDQSEDPPFVKREDGSWLVDAMQAYDTVQQRLGLPDDLELPDAGFTTLAGLIMARLNRIPRVGDKVALGEFTLEVVDMDGRRVDKVLVQSNPPTDSNNTETDGSESVKQ
ncbi:MAG TPA: hemolysin family protein [Roseiflexaceae bacterium]|nr:hemolysin family protein [Roseiflexaceae bacterium]